MGKTLTGDLILLRAKTDRLSNIKNLNLWGNELDNVDVLREMNNVEVLSLSVNKISSLKSFQYCTKLTELYLRKNNIQDLAQVNYLGNLKCLRVLWLWDNPCCEHPLYRSFIIHTIPSLMKLDNTAITPEERQLANSQNYTNLQLETKEEKQQTTPNGYAALPNDHRPAHAPVSSSRAPPAPSLQHQAHSYQAHNKDSKRSGWQKRPSMPPANQHLERYAEEVSPPPPVSIATGSSSRNENILCAVLSLLKQLDAKGLQLVKRDIDRKLGRE